MQHQKNVSIDPSIERSFVILCWAKSLGRWGIRRGLSCIEKHLQCRTTRNSFIGQGPWVGQWMNHQSWKSVSTWKHIAGSKTTTIIMLRWFPSFVLSMWHCSRYWSTALIHTPNLFFRWYGTYPHRSWTGENSASITTTILSGHATMTDASFFLLLFCSIYLLKASTRTFRPWMFGETMDKLTVLKRMPMREMIIDHATLGHLTLCLFETIDIFQQVFLRRSFPMCFVRCFPFFTLWHTILSTLHLFKIALLRFCTKERSNVDKLWIWNSLGCEQLTSPKLTSEIYLREACSSMCTLLSELQSPFTKTTNTVP